MTDPVAIVFGTLLHDVDEEWPGRNQLVLAMRGQRPVVLLGAAPGGRRTLLHPLPVLRSRSDGVLRVGNAFALSGRPKLALIAPLLARFEGWALRLLLSRQGIDRYIIWLTNPGQHLSQGRGGNRYIYDCADPSFHSDVDERFDIAEQQDVRSADLVIATAHSLARRMSQWHSSVHLVPNATARYAAGREWRGDEGPKTAGYVGTIDARFDAAAIAAAASALPDWRFTLVGRVNQPGDEGLARLLRLPNVEITGQVSEAVARRLLCTFSVGLIPFTPRPMNDAINSVKMFDYLAYGMPVASLATEESRRNVFVEVAEDPLELSTAILRAYTDDGPSARRARREWASRNTWDVRAAEVTALLTGEGLL